MYSFTIIVGSQKSPIESVSTTLPFLKNLLVAFQLSPFLLPYLFPRISLLVPFEKLPKQQASNMQLEFQLSMLISHTLAIFKIPFFFEISTLRLIRLTGLISILVEAISLTIYTFTNYQVSPCFTIIYHNIFVT